MTKDKEPDQRAGFKPVFRRWETGYTVPVLFSLLLHGGLLMGFSLFSQSSDNELKVAPPLHIEASLIEQVPVVEPQHNQQVKAARELEFSRKKAEEKALVLQRQEAEKKKEAERKKIAEEKRKESLAREQRQREIKARKEQERLEAQQLKEQKAKEKSAREAAWAKKLAEQQEKAAAGAADKQAQAVAYYSALLNGLVSQQWHRPPSARKNMEALVQVSLSRFGDILALTLTKSSGDEAFDQSVIRAVKQAAPFVELRKMDRTVFDFAFRQFNFRFRPEDLVK